MKTMSKKTDIRPVDELRRELDRLFDDMVPFSWWREKGNGGRELWAPDTDMTETDDEFIIKADLPGTTRDDIEVTFKDHRLTIKGERQTKEEEEKENYLRRERFYGNFVRSLTLPTEVKDEDIKASFNDGVLTVHVPKAEISKPKAIKIN